MSFYYSFPFCLYKLYSGEILKKSTFHLEQKNLQVNEKVGDEKDSDGAFHAHTDETKVSLYNFRDVSSALCASRTWRLRNFLLYSGNPMSSGFFPLSRVSKLTFSPCLIKLSRKKNKLN